MGAAGASAEGSAHDSWPGEGGQASSLYPLIGDQAAPSMERRGLPEAHSADQGELIELEEGENFDDSDEDEGLNNA